MKRFTSLTDFANHLKKVTASYDDKEYIALNYIGKFLQKKSKEKIGHYQQGGGEFLTWAELAESTKADKMKQGYVFNAEFNPLLRSGQLRDSIEYSVGMHKVTVGSFDDIAVYQELGTNRIPPRSFLGLTFYKEKQNLEKILGQFLYNWIADNQSIYRGIS